MQMPARTEKARSGGCEYANPEEVGTSYANWLAQENHANQ